MWNSTHFSWPLSRGISPNDHVHTIRSKKCKISAKGRGGIFFKRSMIVSRVAGRIPWVISRGFMMKFRSGDFISCGRKGFLIYVDWVLTRLLPDRIRFLALRLSPSLFTPTPIRFICVLLLLSLVPNRPSHSANDCQFCTDGASDILECAQLM